MQLTEQQLFYITANSLPIPTENDLCLLEDARQLNRSAITRLLQKGWFWVELSTITGRTVKELQNA